MKKQYSTQRSEQQSNINKARAVREKRGNRARGTRAQASCTQVIDSGHDHSLLKASSAEGALFLSGWNLRANWGMWDKGGGWKMKLTSAHCAVAGGRHTYVKAPSRGNE